MQTELIRKWLDLWHQLLADPDIPPFQEPDDMAGILADFRRNPDCLAKAFAPLPKGEELLDRVSLCIGSEKRDHGAYLIPETINSTDEQLRTLVLEAITRGCQCCGVAAPAYTINILRRRMTHEESCRSGPLVEELGDLFIRLAYDSDSLESEAMKFLREALYTLAASLEVQGYCLTPLCPDEIRQVDPYEPQLALWVRGAQAVVRWNDVSKSSWVDVFVGN